MTLPIESFTFKNVLRSVFIRSAILFGFMNCGYSQDIPIVSFQYDLSLKLSSESIENEIETCFFNDCLYYVSARDIQRSKKLLFIHYLNLNGVTQQPYKISFPNDLMEGEVPKISINKKYLIVKSFETFSLFQKINDRYKLIRREALQHFDNVFALSNGNFLFYEIYNHHPSTTKNKIAFTIYEPRKGQFVKYIYPDLPCIAFSHIYQNYCSVSGNLIAVAAPCSYKIYFYDMHLNIQDSIAYESNDWKNLSGNEIPFITDVSKINAKALIDSLLKLRTSIDLISRIHLLSDSSLLVISSFPGGGSKKRRIDLWQKENQRWVFKARDKEYTMEYESNEMYSDTTFPVMFNSFLPIYNLTDKRFIQISEDDFDSHQKIRWEKYLMLKNKYYETHDPFYSARIFNINVH